MTEELHTRYSSEKPYILSKVLVYCHHCGKLHRITLLAKGTELRNFPASISKKLVPECSKKNLIFQRDTVP
jgi:RNase P subunit RPR2